MQGLQKDLIPVAKVATIKIISLENGFIEQLQNNINAMAVIKLHYHLLSNDR